MRRPTIDDQSTGNVRIFADKHMAGHATAGKTTNDKTGWINGVFSLQVLQVIDYFRKYVLPSELQSYYNPNLT